MKASERRLLVTFCVLVAVVGGLILAQQMRGWQRQLDRREREAELAEIEANALLEDAAEWNAKGAWLVQAQPTAKSAQEADQELLDTVSKKAESFGLSIVTRQLQEQRRTDFYQQYGVALTVKGELEKVFRWIYELQNPQDFRVVPALKILPDKTEPDKVTATVQFWRWYAADVAATPAATPAPDANKSVSQR